MDIPDLGVTAEAQGVFSNEKKYVGNFKKAILMTAGAAVQKLALSLSKEQEVLMYLADMLIELYASESVLLRVEKLAEEKGAEAVQEQIAIAKTYIFDAAEKIHFAGRNALNAFADGDEKRMMLMGLKRFTKTEDLNTIAARRTIATKMIAENGYCF
jgi:hypothetical protein